MGWNIIFLKPTGSTKKNAAAREMNIVHKTTLVKIKREKKVFKGRFEN